MISNNNLKWSHEDLVTMFRLKGLGLTNEVIGVHLSRSPGAINAQLNVIRHIQKFSQSHGFKDLAGTLLACLESGLAEASGARNHINL